MSMDVVMPQLGESVVEGTLTKWLVKEGDFVKTGQTIAEVATDKADSEVPAPAAGTIVSLLAAEGDVVRAGTAIARLEEGENAVNGSKLAEASARPASAPAHQAAAPAPTPQPSSPPAVAGASPSIRKLALENDINLQQITPSGEHGRLTYEDVRRAIEQTQGGRGATTQSSSATPSVKPVAQPWAAAAQPSMQAPNASGAMFLPPIPNVGFGSFKVPAYISMQGDEVVPFSRKRRITADHMVYSKLVSPQVVTVAEVDVHRVMRLREQHKDRYKKEGMNLTVLAFVSTAVVRALKMFPGVNARVVDGATVLLKDINLGVAVDAPDGLVVPNLKHADELSLRGMARSIGDIATRARDGKLTADDFSGSSFTVTNPGLKGNLFGGAIISQPNVAILRMGEIKKRVVVIEQDGEDRMVIHPVMYLALSYDHRVVDGVLGNSFLWTIADLLQKAEFEPLPPQGGGL